jgi:NADPH-dependent ferric siderophore reductase
MTVLVPTAVAWRFFEVSVAAVRRLAPSFVRVTFTGPDLDGFADNGADQRFKLLLPDARGGYDALPTGPDWHDAWRALPDERRNPIRTYTVRAVRPGRREVDVDLVRHGDAGPASAFAGAARTGDRAVLLGPNRDFLGVHGGLEFRPAAGHRGPVLLAGDETAVPAVLSVLEGLPADAHGEAVLEVPAAGDELAVAAPRGVRVTWAVRGGAVGHGERLVPLVEQALARIGLTVGSVPAVETITEADPDELVWEVPEGTAAPGVYAWLAGEAGVVSGLRRRLVRDLGVDRRSVAFMGYWRRGRPGG